MLSFGKQVDENYYLAVVASGVEDYYAGRGEAPGRWLGRGSSLLGLSGVVDGDDLRSVFDGRDPTTGETLVAAADRHIRAFDMCFRAPKSVSVLYGLSGPETTQAVALAHDEAVDAGLRFLERAVGTRRGHAGARVVEGDGFVAAAFRHRTSRAGDPHLHTHVVTANMVRAEGRWTTLDSRELYRLGKTAGCLYEAHLRLALSRDLGVTWGPVVNGIADIEGIPSTVLRHFSTRRAEIEAHLATLGFSSPRAAEIAALDTRKSKEYGVEVAELRRGWRERAGALGFDAQHLVAVLGRATPSELTPRDFEALASKLSGADGLTANDSTFDRAAVLRALCDLLPQGAAVEHVEELADTYLASPGLVPVREGEIGNHRDHRRWTTEEMLAIERAAVNAGLRRGREGAGLAAPEAVAAAVAARPSLAAEQVRMVERLATSGTGVDLVVAPPGAGKTFALDAAREAWERSGLRVVGCALAARAAQELEETAGIPSTSIARHLAEVAGGRTALDHRTVLVVDEAGMAGTRKLARLLADAETVGAKVVLVGDPRQLPEIEAGGLFAGLARRLQPVLLSGNRRQYAEWEQAALVDLRKGRIERALAAYDEAGRVVRGPDATTVREAMADSWWAATLSGEAAVMLARRWSDVDDLNARGRARAAMGGRLTGDVLVVDGRPYQAGDRVVTLRNDYRLGVRNGNTATVVSVDVERRTMTIGRDRGGIASLPDAFLDAGHVAHAYALTIHKAQGMTVERAFLLGTDDLYREAGYTGMSRGRAGNHLFVVAAEHDHEGHGRQAEAPRLDPEAEVARALNQSRAKSMAIDFTAAAEPAAMLRYVHAERRRLAPVVAALPPDRSSARPQLEQALRRAAARVTAAEAEVAEVRRWRPLRSVIGPSAKEAWATARVEDARRAVGEVGRELAVLDEHQGHHDSYRANHRGELERARQLDGELRRVLGRRVSEVTEHPPAYLTGVLGRPPESAGGLRAWQRGAAVVESHRAANEISSTRSALGPKPEAGPERTEWLNASRELADAKRAIVLNPDRSISLGASRGRSHDVGIGL